MNQTVECNLSPDGSHKFTLTTSCDWCYAQALIVNGEVIYVPTVKQQEYHSSTQPNVLFWGGRGSGKSKCGRMDAHMRAIAYPGFKYCILRRTFPELQKSHLLDVPKEMKKFGGYYNKTEHIAYYPNGSTGFFSHCSTEDHVLNLLSSEFYLMFFDEISTFEWDMFTKLSASVRVPDKSGLIGMVRAATNPLGVSADKINTYWVTKEVDPEEDPGYKPEKWHNIHANLIDNPYVDQEQYMDQLGGKGMLAHVRKAWIDGEFGLENALFDVYPTKINKYGQRVPFHHIPQIDLSGLVKNAQIYRVFDMGYFPDPAYCAWIAHFGHRFIVFHEKLWYKTVVSDIAASIKAEDEELGIRKIVTTYCDPTIDINTGADVYTIKDRFENPPNAIPMECSVNDRGHFASVIHSSLSELAEQPDDEMNTVGVPRMQIYVNGKRGCPYLAKTLPLQRFDPKHPLRLADHHEDHATVAIAYFLISSGAMERKEAFIPAKLKKWLQPKILKDTFLGSESVRGPR